MTDFNDYNYRQPQGGAAMMVGAASPLWGLFAVAAAGGVAFWWMTRWTRATNLEAFYASPFGARTPEPEREEAVAILEPSAIETPAFEALVPEPSTAPPVAESGASEAFGAPPEPEPETVEAQARDMMDAVPPAETMPVVDDLVLDAAGSAAPGPQADFAPPLASATRPRTRKPNLNDPASDT